MGGCASKPNDFDSSERPMEKQTGPVQTATPTKGDPPTQDKVKAQETMDAEKGTKEDPLVQISDQKARASSLPSVKLKTSLNDLIFNITRPDTEVLVPDNAKTITEVLVPDSAEPGTKISPGSEEGVVDASQVTQSIRIEAGNIEKMPKEVGTGMKREDQLEAEKMPKEVGTGMKREEQEAKDKTATAAAVNTSQVTPSIHIEAGNTEKMPKEVGTGKKREDQEAEKMPEEVGTGMQREEQEAKDKIAKAAAVNTSQVTPSIHIEAGNTENMPKEVGTWMKREDQEAKDKTAKEAVVDTSQVTQSIRIENTEKMPKEVGTGMQTEDQEAKDKTVKASVETVVSAPTTIGSTISSMESKVATQGAEGDANVKLSKSNDIVKNDITSSVISA